MKKPLFIFLSMVIYSIAIGCTTTQSRFISESNEVIGGVNVRKIQSPKIYKKRSFFTETVTYAPIAGGIAWGITDGKNLEIEDENTGIKKPIGEFSGAIIGGLGGYLGSYLIKKVRPQNQLYKVDAQNYDKWLSKQKNFKNNYIGIESNGYETITFLPKEGYRQFVVSNVYELEMYKKAYGNFGEEGLIDRSLSKDNSEILLQQLYDFSTTEFNKLRVGRKYTLSALDYYTFIERSNKINVLKSEEIATEAANRVNSTETALAFRNSFSTKNELQNQIFDKLYKTLGKTDLNTLLISYTSAKNHQAGMKHLLSLSTNLSEFNETIYRFPQLGIAPKQSPTSFRQAKNYDDWIQNTVGKYLDKSTTEGIRRNFQTQFFNTKFTVATTSLKELEGLNTEIMESDWLYEGIKFDMKNKINDEIEHLERVKRLSVAREEFGDAAPFAFAGYYPNDREVQRLLPELEQLAHKYIKVEEAGIWQAMGNHTVGDDIVGSFFESAKLGGQYNIFVWGILSNSLDYPIKVDLISTLNYSNTSGVSIFTSTTQKTWNESYQAEVPANGKTAFAVVYKDFRVGGTIGSGLLSAGSVSKVNTSNPYTINFKYFNGKISEERKQQQKAFIQKLIKKGNIEINDTEEAKSQREQARIDDRIRREHKREEERNEEELEEAKEKSEKEEKEVIAKREKEEERLKDEEEKIKDCITKTNSSLSKVSYEIAGNWTKLDCPCVHYSDPSFFGSMLRLKYDNKKQWYFIVPSLGWTIPEGPFVSKGDALRGVCEAWYKSKK